MKVIRNRIENFNKTKLIISITMIVLLLLSFFFSTKIENALGLSNNLSKNQTTENKIKDSSYEVTYLDVGQGNSTFIRLPDGKNVVIDGGNLVYGEYIVNFLKERDISSIDYVIATHADADHVSGLISILDNFEVKHILRPFQIAGNGTSAETFELFEYEDLGPVYEYYQSKTNGRSKISRVTSSVYKEFLQKAYTENYHANGTLNVSDVTVFYDGLKILGSNYCFEFFAPLKRDDAVDLSENTTRTKGYATIGYGVNESNSNSAVFLFSCMNDKYLFTGDASFKNGSAKISPNMRFEELDFVESLSSEELVLLSNITVYLAGHHGSEHSSGDELLNLINPRFVVFSVGKDNDYGHPASEVIERIENTKNLEIDYLLRTDINGEITFIKVAGKVLFVTEKNENSRVGYPSWEMFASVICLYFIWFIYSLKLPKGNRGELLKKYNQFIWLTLVRLIKYYKIRRKYGFRRKRFNNA